MPTSLLPHFAVLLLLLLTEALLFSVWLDAGTLSRSGLTGSLISRFGASILRSTVAFSLIFGGFVWLRLASFRNEAIASGRFRPLFAALHAACLAAFGFLSQILFHPPVNGGDISLLGPAWISAGMLSTAFLFLTFGTASLWLGAISRFRDVIAVSGVVALAAGFGGRLAWALWDQVGVLTFTMVRLMVSPLVEGLKVDAVRKTLETARFGVEIAPECSGYEGMGLILAFSCCWLYLYRREYRFPNALLLVPAGIVAIFALNSVRIAALFLIGYHGFSDIALGGFHSQAGWIAFLVVSISFAALSRRVAWISAAGPSVPRSGFRTSDDGTTPALAPFLAIVAASILSGAVKGQFEWFYPLRLVAAGATLWAFRNSYRRLNWTLSWSAPVTGVAVLALWLGLEYLLPSGSAAAAKPPNAPAWWIVLRIVAASITVPIAEELAFRHFLARRLVKADFENVDARRIPLWAAAMSSLVFGLMHGSRWIAGTLAGILYFVEYRRRGSIGDAAVAHGLTNALLAVWVLATDSWQLW